MNNAGLKCLLRDLQSTTKSYNLYDLFKIRDALMTLAQYGLEDKDLLFEVNKFLMQKEQEVEYIGKDYHPKHPDNK